MIGASLRRDPLLVIANWRDRSHPRAGGAEVVCEELARRFVTRGFRVVLLTAAVAGSPRIEQRDGYTIRRRGGSLTVYLHALVWLARHRRHVDAVIDSQNGIPFFTPIVMPKTTPVLMLLYHVHQEQFASYLPTVGAAVARWLERTGSRLVYGHRSVVTISPSTREGARSILGLRGAVWVAPPGAPAQRTHGPTRSRVRTDFPSIVCVGRLVPHKRTHLIVEMMPALLKEFPTLELHIVGDGPDRPRLDALVAKLDLESSVRLHGPLPPEERDRLLENAWLTINSSLGEGWGLSIVEAQALGVPALAFRRPGVRDSIRDQETGWLVDEEQALAEATAGALRELGDPHRANELTTQAQAWVRRFTWDGMADQILDVLAAEDARLAKGRADRRSRSDLASLVVLPLEALPDGWQPSLRRTDRCVVDATSVTLLLHGADTPSVLAALRRMHVPETALLHPATRVEIARPCHHLSPVLRDPDPPAVEPKVRVS